MTKEKEKKNRINAVTKHGINIVYVGEQKKNCMFLVISKRVHVKNEYFT